MYDDNEYDYYDFKPYVPAATRRRQAARELAALKKNGTAAAPVVITGTAIARTFWGKAWCHNLESYSDYSNRLPRGRSYVRNGSVVDLQIVPGEVTALVSGSMMYKTQVSVAAVPKARWSGVCKDCAGGIDSVVELLQGRLSTAVMARICQQKTGLFPSPAEIKFSCSCPDWASMCKHVAAVLYGIGARLDHQPDLLFRLRRVDHLDLIASAGTGLPQKSGSVARAKVLDSKDLSGLFGIEIAQDAKPRPAARAKSFAQASKATARVKTKTKTTKLTTKQSTKKTAMTPKNTKVPSKRAASAPTRSKTK